MHKTANAVIVHPPLWKATEQFLVILIKAQYSVQYSRDGLGVPVL